MNNAGVFLLRGVPVVLADLTITDPISGCIARLHGLQIVPNQTLDVGRVVLDGQREARGGNAPGKSLSDRDAHAAGDFLLEAARGAH